MKSPHDFAVVTISGKLRLMIDAYFLSLQRKVILFGRWATSFLAFLEFHVDIVEVSRVHTEYTD